MSSSVARRKFSGGKDLVQICKSVARLTPRAFHYLMHCAKSMFQVVSIILTTVQFETWDAEHTDHAEMDETRSSPFSDVAFARSSWGGRSVTGGMAYWAGQTNVEEETEGWNN